MFNTLLEDINQMNDDELAEISLRETLSLEEMICDTVFEEQVAITNLTNSGTPRNQSLDATVSSLMFHNQDHLGMSEEDAFNFDPDQAHLDLNKDALETNDSSMDSSADDSLTEQLLRVNEMHSEPDGDEDYDSDDAGDEDDDSDEDDSSYE